MSETVLTITVTDDDDAVRMGLEAVLSGPGRRVTAFSHGAAFLDHAAVSPPDVAFLDLKMPGLSGLDVLRRLNPVGFPVIMVSAHGDIATAVEAIRLGARDFVEKPFTPVAIEAALAQALETSDESASTDRLEALTAREREVAAALDQGLTNKEIARALEISPRTVEIHRSRVFAKLDVRNVAGLVRLLAETR